MSSRRSGSSSSPRGFTLVELLVVIAIIGVLVGLLLPAVQAARESARRSACSNNCKQLGLGLQNYHDSKQKFPPLAYLETVAGQSVPAGGNSLKHWTWLTLILPFMEQDDLYDRIVATPTPFSPASPPAAVQQQINTILCPSDRRLSGPATRNLAYTNYAASEGLHWWSTGFLSPTTPPVPTFSAFTNGTDTAGLFAQTLERKMSDIVDGTSKTVALAEVTGNSVTGGPAYTSGSMVRYRADTDGERVYRVAYFYNGLHGNCCDTGQYKYVDGSTRTTGGTWLPAPGPHPFSASYLTTWGPNTEWPGADSYHFGVLNCVMADGSVQAVRMDIPWHVWVKVNGVADAYQERVD
jgi:prepilin-type N-terminal cleavage/methylation domain-containing protein